MATENPRVWFKSISLENVRSFGTKQTINFTNKDGNAARWNLILGDNGTGKTTVLKAMVGALNYFMHNDFTLSSNYIIDSLKRKSLTDLRIGYSFEIFENNVKKINEYELKTFVTPDTPVVVSKEGKIYIDLWDEPESKLLLFAYGASRRIGNGGVAKDEFYSKTDAMLRAFITLFRDDKSLINAEEWLIQADYLRLKDQSNEKKFNGIYRIIEVLFRGEAPGGIMFDTSSGAPQVKLCTHYGAVRIHELSLGYKTLIAWMVDFANGLFDRYPHSEDPLAEPAVCLVDEIDLHLHPKFQRTIIQFLTDTFPNTQFIVTAHSPLIVQSAEDANIILLKREGNETHVADGIDVHSWRIDQILSSDLFGGVSGRPAKTEERIQRRRALLLKDKRTDTENHELEKLEEELGMLTASESKEALQALELIGKALSK